MVLGFASVRATCGGGAAAWVTGVLAAPGTQGSWQLGQQDIQCSRRVRQPVLANMLQYSCLENTLPCPPPPPTSDREAWQASQQGRRVAHGQRNPADMSVPQAELSVKAVQLLGLRGPWWCQMCRDMDYLHHRSYGHVRVFPFEPLVAGIHKASLAILSP